MMAAEHPEATADGLIATGLTLRYGNVVALRGVDLRVPAGAVVALLGANGAGKTSLIRAVSGTSAAHSATVGGTLTWEGRSLRGRPAAEIVRRGIAQAPEGRRIFARMTVHENLLVGRQGARVPLTDALERVHTLFPVLAERRTQPAGLLSGGEQQMLAIGRALMAEPRLLLLDEPSLGLAPRMVGTIMRIIADINATGVSVLLVEQNAHMALQAASHVTVLELGRVVHSGHTSDDALMERIRALYLHDAAPTAADAQQRRRPRPPLEPWHERRTA
ncbi:MULTISPECIES: ABC transporter ATP-binding protein [unclassified Microbacterium]|uniref:ABC transporter ATP-binding protein n=1 Tax=unclassified Microbacterium TaxID=2609290 RepID=UPI003015D5F7